MIEIDGSMGEGGGSVLRLSTALATTLNESIRVTNIRVKKENPGLRPQHLMGLRALAELCKGELTGDEVGSTEIRLNPGKIQGREINVEIETAGSVCLVLQTLMILAMFSNSKTTIKFRGGATDTFFAPSIDYLKNVTLPMLRKVGYSGEVECKRRGHYPKGGARVKAQIYPVKKIEPLHLEKPGEIKSISGKSHSVKLPGHIAKREAESAEKYLEESGYKANIEIESYKKSEDPHIAPGTGITLWAKSEKDAILGDSALGKKGKPAEVVGKEAAEDLVEQLKTGRSLDLYLTDQIIPYLALADGKSVITTSKISSHTLTNLKIVQEILEVNFEVEGKEGQPGKITIKGHKK